MVDETVLTQSVVAGGYLSEDVLKAFVDGGQKVLDAAIDRAKARGVTAHGILVEDITETVADVIVTEAHTASADLIILGTHGRRGMRRLVMGSDAEGVVRLTTVPVMLVRQQDPNKS